MIELKELIRAELKQYIEANDDIKPGMEAKLIKIITDILQGDKPSLGDVKVIFDNIDVEI